MKGPQFLTNAASHWTQNRHDDTTTTLQTSAVKRVDLSESISTPLVVWSRERQESTPGESAEHGVALVPVSGKKSPLLRSVWGQGEEVRGQSLETVLLARHRAQSAAQTAECRCSPTRCCGKTTLSESTVTHHAKGLSQFQEPWVVQATEQPTGVHAARNVLEVRVGLLYWPRCRVLHSQQGDTHC